MRNILLFWLQISIYTADVSKALTLVDVFRALTGIKRDELFRPSFLVSARRLDGLKNEPCYLRCEIDHAGNYTLRWTKDDNVIAEGKHVLTSDSRFEIDKFEITKYGARTEAQSILLINNPRTEDSGNYTCHIVGVEPPMQMTHLLTVFDPKIVTTNQKFIVAVGDTIVLPCDVKGFEGHPLKRWLTNWAVNTFDDVVFEGTDIEEHGEGLDVELVDGYNLKIRNITTDYPTTWYCYVYSAYEDWNFLQTGNFDWNHFSRFVKHTLKVVDKNKQQLKCSYSLMNSEITQN